MHGNTEKAVVRGGAQGWERGWRAAVARIGLWHRRLSTRRALRELESHRLGDIGLTDRDRRREGSKWFWQD